MDVGAFLTGIPPALVYLVVGLVIGLESLGIPLPGEVVLVGAALLTTGPVSYLSPHSVAIAAVTGAVIGDSIGYAVGRRFGPRLFDWLTRRFPHHVSPAALDYARHVFGRYGVWAVFFGRFVALLRILAGPLAGSMHMPYPRFLVANISGGIVWAAGTTYAIHYLGAVAHHWLKDFSYVGLVLAIIAGVTLSTVMRKRIAARIDAFAASQESRP